MTDVQQGAAGGPGPHPVQDRSREDAPRPERGPAPGEAPAPVERQGAGAPRRVAYLDVVRGLAMIGVVLMNAPSVVFPAEMTGERESTILTSVVDTGLSLLVSGKARAMLMVLLGVGAVLAWRSAVRRGGRPTAVMLRRYAVLGLLFGVPHLLVFDGDILTHYALAALLLAPLMPWLTGGTARRPAVAALALFAAAPFADLLLDSALGWQPLTAPLFHVPQTLGLFCVGVWLARRPELAPGGELVASRLPTLMLWTGLAVQVLGYGAMFAADVFFPMEMGADGVPVLGDDGMPVVPPGSPLLVSLASTLMGGGGALFYLGLVWWLVRRGRTASRLLGALAPLGRMTLTVYLGSTAVFLAVMGPLETAIPLLAQYGLAVAYFVVAVAFAHVWTGWFRLGPLEWVWRSLTYLRPMPMRRGTAGTDAGTAAGPGVGAGAAQGSVPVSGAALGAKVGRYGADGSEAESGQHGVGGSGGPPVSSQPEEDAPR
ncbi:DUF418 domain-containing protein [Nocardiopsis sp. NPDC058631]|uniref:DUF418 domain-containing protein n=1 Tax=Nocardiopsis sp. NPDC058631 TaxID=3346566 RepID=UPI00365BF878